MIAAWMKDHFRDEKHAKTTITVTSTIAGAIAFAVLLSITIYHLT
jgi:hypothetical protein